MRFFATAALAAGLLLAATAPAAAQDPMSPESITDNANSMNQAISHSQTSARLLDESVRRNNANGGAARARAAAAAKGKGRPAGGAAAAKAGATTSFAYVPTAALRQQTVANYVAQAKAVDPAGAATLAAELKPGKTEYPALYR